jgi:hypothetical protein
MDWATFFEKYSDSLFGLGGVCLGVFASFAGLIMGYFFQKWSDQRKRDWELKDRETNRHIAIHDMRIQEARSFLDSYQDIVHNTRALEGSLTGEISGEALNPLLLIQPEKHVDKTKSYQQIMEAIAETKIKKMSILILDDAELNKQTDALVSLVFDELIEIPKALKKRSYLKTPVEEKDKYLGRVVAFSQRANIHIQLAHTRLDELAKGMHIMN